MYAVLLFLWRLKVPEQLQTVDVAESEYIASILALNSYTTEFQPEMEAKLKQFQVRRCSALTYLHLFFTLLLAVCELPGMYIVLYG